MLSRLFPPKAYSSLHFIPLISLTLLHLYDVVDAPVSTGIGSSWAPLF